MSNEIPTSRDAIEELSRRADRLQKVENAIAILKERIDSYGKLTSGHSAAPDRFRAAMAGLLHLHDLIRAGHTPEATEYDVGEGYAHRITSPNAERFSLIGSSAAACSE